MIYEILENRRRCIVDCMKERRWPYGAGFVGHKGKDDSHKNAHYAHCRKSRKGISEVFHSKIMPDIGERPVPYSPYDSADHDCFPDAPEFYHLIPDGLISVACGKTNGN